MSDDRASVHIVDVFDAPREVVFAAWTEPERLKKWWGPGVFETCSPKGRGEVCGQPLAPRGKPFVRQRTASLFDARTVPARMEISSQSRAS